MKWLSDEELYRVEENSLIPRHITAQAREANRLREGLALWRKRITAERDHLISDGRPSIDPFLVKTEITLDHLNELLEGE